MNIQLNGKQCEIGEKTNILKLLEEKKVTNPLIIVLVNGEVVPKHQHEDTFFSQGDQVELIQLTGGG